MARRQKAQSVEKTGPPATCLAGGHQKWRSAAAAPPRCTTLFSIPCFLHRPFFSFSSLPRSICTALHYCLLRCGLLQTQRLQGETTQPLAACYQRGRRTDVCACPVRRRLTFAGLPVPRGPGHRRWTTVYPVRRWAA